MLRDIYIDDRTWKTLFTLSDSFGPVAGPQRLVEPSRIGIHWEGFEPQPFIPALIAEAQRFPSASTARPVSQQYALRSQNGGSPSRLAGVGSSDPHLRSCLAMEGYTVNGPGGALGRVADFILDPATLHVESMVVETETAGARHLMAIPIGAVSVVSFATQSVRLHQAESALGVQRYPDLSRAA